MTTTLHPPDRVRRIVPHRRIVRHRRIRINDHRPDTVADLTGPSVDVSSRPGIDTIFNVRENPPSQVEGRSRRAFGFSVARGECVGVTEACAGMRSSILEAIARLVEPAPGTIEVSGARAALVPRHRALAPTLDVRSNVEAWARLFGLTGTNSSTKVCEVLTFTDLRSRQRRSAERLDADDHWSLGVAVALLHSPEVLVMEFDRAEAGAISEGAMVAMFERLRRAGLAIVVVAREEDGLEKFCDRVVKRCHQSD